MNTNPIVTTPPPPSVIAKAEEYLAKKQERDRTTDQAGRQASLEPLPGPLRNVFAIPQDIEAAGYRIRPFYDADFEFLSILKHPLHQMMIQGMDGKAPEANQDYIPRGPNAWNLAWIMTTSIEEAEQAIMDGSLAEKAKRAFSKLQLGALLAINQAIVLQVQKYWEPVIGYGSVESEGEKRPNPTQSSGAQLTVLAG